MVICNYFLKGQCRFGDSCKNEHSYNSNNASSVLLKKPEVDISMFIKFASGDMLKAEKGNQWPLSCYGPYQAKPCFPGFDDKSFEEVRLGFYEAQRNGTIEQYKEQLSQILNEARMKIKSLQNPTTEATNVLKDLYYSNNTGVQQNSIFGTTTSSVFNNSSPNQNSVFGNNNQRNIFGGPVQTNQTSANNFSFQGPQSNSIFGNNQIPVQNQPLQTGNSIFGNVPNQNTFSGSTQSIFGGTAQQTQPGIPGFGSNSVFQNSPNTPVNHSTSIFGNNQPAANIFGNNTNTSAANVFVSNPSSTQSSIFGSNTSAATNPNTFSSNSNTSVFGSNISSAVQAPAPTNSPFGNSPFVNPQPSTNIFSTFNNKDNSMPANVNPFLNANNTITPIINNSPFNTTSNTNNTISQPVFNSEKPHSHSASIFGNQPATPLLNIVKKDDSSVYSKISDLNANDIAQYEKPSFDLGFIPTRAPTLEMC